MYKTFSGSLVFENLMTSLAHTLHQPCSRPREAEKRDPGNEVDSTQKKQKNRSTERTWKGGSPNVSRDWP